MQISDRILDDLLRKAFRKLLASKHRAEATRGGARELIGVLLKLERPRARLSRSETRGRAFSCLGELLWYLSGDNQLDFIRHYIKKYEDESEDKKTVYGGYGPRIFCQRLSSYSMLKTSALRLGTRISPVPAHSNSWCATTSCT